MISKIIKLVKSPHPFRALISVVNNSPLRHLTKAFVQILHWHLTAKRRDAAASLPLPPKFGKALLELRQYGVTNLTGLVDAEALKKLQIHAEWAATQADQFRKHNGVIKKTFWTELIERKGSILLGKTSDPMVKFAMQEELVALVSHYLGTLPKLNYVLLTLSEATPEKLSHSQLWHQDRDDLNLVKIFAYFTDVKETADGPFTFVNAPNSLNASNSFFLKHLQDKDFFKSVKKTDVIEMFGKSLTVFAVDTTRCYHMGSRVGHGHHRLMYTANFLSYPSAYFDNSSLHVSVDSEITKLQKTLFLNESL